MSYRSIKRVLGETNLERKCLVLFGACLFLLITAAFWYAERNAEQLVKDKTKKTGQDFVDLSLLRYHFEEHFNPSSALVRPGGNWPDMPALLREMDRDLLTQNFEWEILVLDEAGTIDQSHKKTRLPRTEHERAVMAELKWRLEEQIRQRPAPEAVGPTAELRPVPDVDSDRPATESLPDEPLIEDRPGEPSALEEVPSEPLLPVSKLEARAKKYYYYQPVYWRDSCIVCHLTWGGVFAPLQQEKHPELRGPLRIMKVAIPSEETQLAMTKSRAILLATAIVTVFVSVIALYLVVRYVIVKPLNHLRDVSDEISRGNTNLRADIQTNDEFEDLAASFNRMLRHLVDTQEELRRVNGDLDGRLDQLAQANMQLHEMNRLRSDFLANMSHELRTPLNSIIGFSDVLRGIDSLNEKQKRWVDNIGKSGRVLLEMINDILDLAKMESGRMGLRLTDFSIEAVIHAQCDLVRALSEEKNIDLEAVIEPNLPLMHQDQAKVQQILTNLLSNAIKFTPEGGRIVVSARRDRHDDLVLSVEDTGVGIAEEDRQIIFEKFRQGTAVLGNDGLTRKFSGTGLGLSIVKELCRLLGGEISFESEFGKGSRFTARLPWHRKDQPQLESGIAARLDEVTNAQRMEMLRGTNPAPQVAPASDESRPLSTPTS